MSMLSLFIVFFVAAPIALLAHIFAPGLGKTMIYVSMAVGAVLLAANGLHSIGVIG